MVNEDKFLEGYKFLDCGDGARLEQFGAYTLIRPSSLAIWNRRHPNLWNKYHAEYDHETGWQFNGKEVSEWQIKVGTSNLMLRLQRNGQIGFFPEHATYLSNVTESVERIKKTKNEAKLLNLFAYTGMATVACAQAGAAVTHVDLLKPCLDWARANLDINSIPNGVRLIPEEAITFVEREVKRGNRYDIIILDPPGFSRISKQQSWSIEDILPKLVRDLSKIVNPGGEIFFTCHGAEHGSTIVRNIFEETLGTNITVEERQLILGEPKATPLLPAGYLVRISC